MHLPKGEIAYRAKGAADSVYNLVQGVVKTYDILPDDSISVSGFHFAGDMFGLAEQGQYVKSAEAVIPSVAFRIPLDALESLLTRNTSLGTRLLCKAADELRKNRRHARILCRNDALGRFALLLRMLEEIGAPRGPDSATYFPMSRGDAAQFIGLTLEAMSRASSALERARVVRIHRPAPFRDHRPRALRRASGERASAWSRARQGAQGVARPRRRGNARNHRTAPCARYDWARR